jgi:hypothetical protein
MAVAEVHRSTRSSRVLSREPRVRQEESLESRKPENGKAFFQTLLPHKKVAKKRWNPSDRDRQTD